MTILAGLRAHITGIVQGVGFRPFIFNLAERHALTGWVQNTSGGVVLEVAGAPEALAAFQTALPREIPPLAHIAALQWEACAPGNYAHFEIRASAADPNAFQPIPPDLALCADCARELTTPTDRRFGYPFINCTNCGPRFTLITALPYDRPNTTMAAFPLCPACAAEYANPRDRRFHAQPIACPDCGPKVWLEREKSSEQLSVNSEPLSSNRQLSPVTSFQSAISNQQSAISKTRALLISGQILALKGLGGFHLACDATNEKAVAELRRRKRRSAKPFALMLPDMPTIERFCVVTDAERALLTAPEHPIVLLQKRPATALAPNLAPGQNTLGVMLPYTPLHHLLLAPAPDFPPALVMTSGNLSEEPIVTANADALTRLAPLADAFLLHNREIFVRCDDSVVKAVERREWREESGEWLSLSSLHSPLFFRRSRGYAPTPLDLPFVAPPLLATGAELKNTFCLAREKWAFLSHHIGDLENYETLQAFESGLAHFERLFRVTPQLLAHDLHPDYLATRYALARAERERLPTLGIQHHHAHLAACLADNGHPGDEPVLGLIFDGTGYGTDGAIWGGEVLVGNYAGFERWRHLAYVRLPGGDRAVREPWRMALAWLHYAGVDWADLPPTHAATPTQRAALHAQLQNGINAPFTSSLGRLFDALAALTGLCPVVDYEAQAAIELEALVDDDEIGLYPIEVGPAVIDPAPLIRAVAADVRAEVARPIIAARIHNSFAALALEIGQMTWQKQGIKTIALSGGVWQNRALLQRTVPLLTRAGFGVYTHRHTPPNDGGLALGQAAIAAWVMKNDIKSV